MDDLEVQVQEKLIAGGSIAIVSQAQHMKIPYSLLKSVKYFQDRCTLRVTLSLTRCTR